MTAAVYAPVALVLLACGGAQHLDPPRCPIDRRLVLASPDEVRRALGCQTASAVIVRTGATLDLALLGRLESIDGDLVIGPTVGVDEVQLVALRSVGGGVSVTDNAALELFDAGALVTIGKELVVDGAPSLTLLELGALVKDAGIRIERAPALPHEVVEQLGKPPASP